ncbi:hypothetical protein J3F84DRAFT_402084, partial [Trichoderma pleuroticola]
ELVSSEGSEKIRIQSTVERQEKKKTEGARSRETHETSAKAAKKRNIRPGALKMIGHKRPPPDDGNGVFALLFACVFVVGMVCARVCGDAQMNTTSTCNASIQVYKYHKYMCPAAFGASSDMRSAEATGPLASSKFCAATIQKRHHLELSSAWLLNILTRTLSYCILMLLVLVMMD